MYTVGLFSRLPGLILRVMLKAPRLLPDGSQTIDTAEMDAEPSLCRANVLKRVSAQSLSLGSTLRDLGWIYPCTARRVMRAGWQRLRKPVNASAPTHSVERLRGVSWICRRASWDKSERPYRACVNKKRAAQDENRALGDTVD